MENEIDLLSYDKFCIFGNKHQFASVAQISPQQMNRMIKLEKQFGCTIKRKINLPSLIAQGTPYKTITEEMISLATAYNYNQPILLSPDEKWDLPADLSCGSP